MLKRMKPIATALLFVLLLAVLGATGVDAQSRGQNRSEASRQDRERQEAQDRRNNKAMADFYHREHKEQDRESRERQEAQDRRNNQAMADFRRADREQMDRYQREQRQAESRTSSRSGWADRNGGGGSDYVQDRLARERHEAAGQARERQQREFQRDWELGENIRRENERNSPDYHAGRPENRYSVVPMPSTRDIPPRNYSRGVFEQDQREGSNQRNVQYPSQQDSKQYSSGLNRAETHLYAANPRLISVVTYYRGVAEKETQRRFGGSRRNDQSDAFRHAYAAALLSHALGPYYAQMITDAHEMTTGNPDHERYMDIHNNRIGIRIGLSPQRRGMSSEEQLADLTERALRSGWLVFYE